MFALLPVCTIRRRLAVAIFLTTAACLLDCGICFRQAFGQPPARGEKTAIPDAESQEKASKLFRDVVKDKLDAAKTASAKRRLARELLENMSAMANDPAECYVVLREAGRLAFEACDYGLSLDVIDAMDERFEFDASSLRRKIFNAEEADPDSRCEDRFALGIQLMRDAVANGQSDLAMQIADSTQKAADESPDPTLRKFFGRYRARVEKSLHAGKAEKDFLTRLAQSPDDAAAKLALGRLYCLDRGDWDKGLPLLAAGADPTLKQIAAKDMESPSDVAERMKLGDTWWQFAQEKEGPEKRRFLDRAGYWYRLAQQGDLSGLAKVKVEKRLKDIGPAVPMKIESGEIDIMADIHGLAERRSQGLRPIVLSAGGGTRQTERAVTAALIWLANHQLSDGSWSIKGYTQRCVDKSCIGTGNVTADAGATAMGLLPFLAAGQTHKSKNPYKDHIGRGIGWLLRNQQPDGNLARGSQQMMYSHGLATIALAEAYGLSGDRKVGMAAQKAVDFILRAQNPADGGWRYNPGDPGDTSVVGWQLMALKSAHIAGLNVGGSAFFGTSKWLDAAAVHDGSEYSYQPGQGSSPTMTAVGLLCRQYLGAKRDNPMCTGGMAYLMGHMPDEGFKNVYYWYYATQVMHNMNNYEWDQWNRKMRDLLVRTQCRDESCAKGSWDPTKDAWGQHGGRVMQTSLSALTLEIYYRYAPLYGK